VASSAWDFREGLSKEMAFKPTFSNDKKEWDKQRAGRTFQAD
jgi:hypothetical protein